MKISIVLIFFFISFLAKTQENIKVFSENTNQGYLLFASNSANCPISISLELELENLSFSEGPRKIFLIPETTEKFKLGELSVLKPGKAYKYSSHYLYNYGDINLNDHDTTYEYFLPFQKGASFEMFQGYNGSFTHKNENALDFTMPEGTEILAVRDGIVIEVVEKNTEYCPREDCKKYNNYIIIYHSDGTFAEYVHIKHNGSKVKAGDHVNKGDLIAYSGNTGWSTGPHLHFSCYLPGLEKGRTIKTKFKIGDGSKSDYLQEKVTYSRDY
jgi:murein DD-endopeptidase MepM/ murein hydrolase activator NlpD